MSRRASILFAHGCLLLVVGIAAVPQISEALGLRSSIYSASLLFTAVCTWCLCSWRLSGRSIVDPYVLFFLTAAVFNGGQATLEACRLNTDQMLRGSFSAEVIVSTLHLVTAALVILHLGALLARPNSSSLRMRQGDLMQHRRNAQDTRSTGGMLLWISLLPAIIVFVDQVKAVMVYGYFSLYQRTAPTGFAATPRILAGFLVPAAMFLLAGRSNVHDTRLLSAFIMSGYVLTFMFIGARSWAIVALVAYVWLWNDRIRRLSRIRLLCAALVILAVLPVIRIVRDYGGELRSSPQFWVATWASTHNPFVASISEMGASMQTVAYTMELVPATRPYDLGSSYLYALLTLVPNFFWDLHPAITHGTPSDWLISAVDPQTAARGGGIGFSFIAEAYLNFGWTGLLLFGPFGWWLARLGAVARVDPARSAAVACAVAFLCLYARNESADVVRGLCWYAAAPYLFASMIRHYRARRLTGRSMWSEVCTTAQKRPTPAYR